VIDVDPRNGGDQALERLQVEHGKLPSTLTVATGGGGTHFYFRAPSGVRFKKELVPGIDLKSRGGYVLAPPSNHESGGIYEWINHAALADLPEWVAYTMREAETTRAEPTLAPPMPDELARARTPALVAAVSPHYLDGRKHNVALALGGYLGKNGWSPEAISEVVGALPSRDPGARIRDALDAQRRGAHAAGFGVLSELLPSSALAEVEHQASNPAAAAWADRAMAGFRAGAEVANDVDAWRPLSVSEIFAPLAPIRHLVPALDIAPGAPTVLGGYGFSGKTLCAQSLAISIAAGQFVFGSLLARPGRVLHVDYEQGAHLTRDRYQRLAVASNVAPAALSDRLVLVSMPRIYADTRDAEALLGVRCAGFDLVIVDSLLASCPSIEENDSGARRVLDMFTRISEATGACVAIVHHARKPSKDAIGGAKMALRGSGAIYDAASSVLMFEAEQGEPVQVTHTKARNTGQPHDPFVLKIDDVPSGANPRAGLRVTLASADEQAQRVHDRRSSEACEAIRRAFAGIATPFTSKDAIRAKTGLGAERFRLAYAELQNAGELVEGGSTRDRMITLIPRAAA